MRFYLLLSLVGTALADSPCWSPNAPNEDNPDMCVQCVQHPAWDANMCQVGDQQYDCSPTIEACCASGSIIWSGACQGIAQSDCTSRCITNSNSAPPPTPTDSPLPNVSDTCKDAVSTQNGGSNIDCMNKCQNAINSGSSWSSVPEFVSGVCSLQGWKPNNGRTDVTSSPCFEKWVYGYSQEAVNAALDGLYHKVDTPAQCQALCQEEPECVNWIWFSDLTQSNEPQYTHGCALKNQKQVDKAIQQTTQTPQDVVTDPTWCNVNMPYSCTYTYNCLPCQGTKRCVWESDMHVTGWKYCQSLYDHCNPDPTTPTSTSTSTSSSTTLAPTTTSTTPAPTTTSTTPAPTTTSTTPEPTTTSTTPEPTTTSTTTPEPTSSTTPEPEGPTDATAAPTDAPPCPDPNPSPCGCSCSDSNCGCCRPACQQGCSGAGCCHKNDIVVRIGDKPQFFKMEIHN